VTVFYFNIYVKADFSAGLSVSNDPSEIILICWFAAQWTIINVENSCGAYCNIFLWKLWHLFSWWI